MAPRRKRVVSPTSRAPKGRSFLARSRAAKKGWETRRKNARSRAAKKGWETRRKKARAEKRREKKTRGTRRSSIYQDFADLFSRVSRRKVRLSIVKSKRRLYSHFVSLKFSPADYESVFLGLSAALEDLPQHPDAGRISRFWIGATIKEADNPQPIRRQMSYSDSLPDALDSAAFAAESWAIRPVYRQSKVVEIFVVVRDA